MKDDPRPCHVGSGADNTRFALEDSILRQSELVANLHSVVITHTKDQQVCIVTDSFNLGVDGRRSVRQNSIEIYAPRLGALNQDPIFFNVLGYGKIENRLGECATTFKIDFPEI